MNSPLRFGIVGCGVIAATHADALLQVENARLTACCDIVVSQALKFGRKYGLERDHVHFSIRSILQDPEVDCICICTPSGTHAELGVATLSAGKPVIIEKPMDVTDDACSLLSAVQKSTGLQVAVVSQHRFDPASILAHELVESGRLGRLIFGEAQIKWLRTQEYYDSGEWRGTWELDGGGALMNQGIHTVDLLLWMMGPVETVYAVARTLAHTGIEVEDVICATVTFMSGAIANIAASTAAYPGYPAQLNIHGTLGSFVICGDALISLSLREPGEIEHSHLVDQIGTTVHHAVEVARGGTRSAESNKALAAHENGAKWGDSHRAQIVDFIESVRNHREPSVGCAAGQEAVRLILAAYESARTGRIVHLT